LPGIKIPRGNPCFWEEPYDEFKVELIPARTARTKQTARVSEVKKKICVTADAYVCSGGNEQKGRPVRRPRLILGQEMEGASYIEKGRTP